MDIYLPVKRFSRASARFRVRRLQPLALFLRRLTLSFTTVSLSLSHTTPSPPSPSDPPLRTIHVESLEGFARSLPIHRRFLTLPKRDGRVTDPKSDRGHPLEKRPRVSASQSKLTANEGAP